MDDVSWDVLSVVVSAEGEEVGAYFLQRSQMQLTFAVSCPSQELCEIEDIYTNDHLYTQGISQSVHQNLSGGSSS